MSNKQKRMFISNLPPDTNENEIKSQFSTYGNVVSVEIKQRRQLQKENVSPVFAFVNIEIDHFTLNKCFQKFADYDWNGYRINLQLAKESFLDRLKREREEQIIVQNRIDDNEIEIVKQDYVPPVDKHLYKRTEFSSNSESNSSESEEEPEPLIVKKTVVEKSKNDLDYVIKDNKFKFLNGKAIKIEKVSDKQIHIIESKQKQNDIKDKRALEAEEKRRKSLVLMKNSYVQQKSIIKSALSNVDSKKNNKIIFNDETVENESTNKRKYNENHENANQHKKNRVSLFDDNDDEEEKIIDFGIKKQFEGEKGQKLLHLQSRFTNDKRFTFDSRFLDNEDEPQKEKQELPEEDEKQKQLDILESVLGHKVVNKKSKEIENKESTKPRKTMLRYDPSKSEHSKFEIKFVDKKETNKKSNKEKKEAKLEDPKVEVSKETFYKVTTNLKESLQDNKSFSLLSMFGRTEEVKAAENYNQTHGVKEINKTKSFGVDRNPFKYDSSDLEDEVADKNDEKDLRYKKVKPILKVFKRETFFFQKEDERLNEVAEFLQKLNGQESDKPFNEKRRELKKIVRDKIKNNQRNHRPFQKKIGRHKMIKVKKAKKK